MDRLQFPIWKIMSNRTCTKVPIFPLLFIWFSKFGNFELIRKTKSEFEFNSTQQKNAYRRRKYHGQCSNSTIFTRCRFGNRNIHHSRGIFRVHYCLSFKPTCEKAYSARDLGFVELFYCDFVFVEGSENDGRWSEYEYVDISATQNLQVS